ncbi:MAG: spermidine synthase, partial [Thiohalomonadales bacterium]
NPSLFGGEALASRCFSIPQWTYPPVTGRMPAKSAQLGSTEKSMAVIWRKKVEDKLYELRTAGNSRRLYTDGVFHSQYNPKQLFTGSIWDLLTLPGLFLLDQGPLRILMLGVGGGTSILQLNTILKPSHIVGIEWDKTHISIAKRFFGLNQHNIELIYDDAERWLRNYSGSPFDLIIDDLFCEHNNEPVRAVPANTQWFTQLLIQLSPKGLIVQNHISARSFRHCAYFQDPSIHCQFKSAFRIHASNIDNIVGVFCKQALKKSDLLTRLTGLRQLPVSINRYKLDFVLRKISY